MAVARRHIYRSPFAVFHVLQGEVNVALRGHQLQTVTFHKLVFHRHRGQVAPALAGKLADKLLTLGNGVAVFVVLIAVVGVAAQEPFGLTAVGEAFQRFH